MSPHMQRAGVEKAMNRYIEQYTNYILSTMYKRCPEICNTVFNIHKIYNSALEKENERHTNFVAEKSSECSSLEESVKQDTIKKFRDESYNHKLALKKVLKKHYNNSIKTLLHSSKTEPLELESVTDEELMIQSDVFQSYMESCEVKEFLTKCKDDKEFYKQSNKFIRDYNRVLSDIRTPPAVICTLTTILEEIIREITVLLVSKAIDNNIGDNVVYPLRPSLLQTVDLTSLTYYPLFALCEQKSGWLDGEFSNEQNVSYLLPFIKNTLKEEYSRYNARFSTTDQVKRGIANLVDNAFSRFMITVISSLINLTRKTTLSNETIAQVWNSTYMYHNVDGHSLFVDYILVKSSMKLGKHKSDESSEADDRYNENDIE